MIYTYLKTFESFLPPPQYPYLLLFRLCIFQNIGRFFRFVRNRHNVMFHSLYSEQISFFETATVTVVNKSPVPPVRRIIVNQMMHDSVAKRSSENLTDNGLVRDKRNPSARFVCPIIYIVHQINKINNRILLKLLFVNGFSFAEPCRFVSRIQPRPQYFISCCQQIFVILMSLIFYLHFCWL